jgi:cyanophycin synthetase
MRVSLPITRRTLAYRVRIVRLVEIRLYDGPNVYRLEPVVKVELAVGRSRAWHGERMPAANALVHLARTVPGRDWPDAVADVAAWTRRLRVDHGEHEGPLLVHRGTDTGRWVVTWPWAGAERSRAIAEAAVDLAARSVASGRRVRLTGTQQRLVERWEARITAASAAPPTWIRDPERRIPVISITGTNGKSTVTRLITHILMVAGHHVGTTTSDGILVDERMLETGDWTGPGGAQTILRRDDVDTAVLETARGGLVLRGMGYESNEASVFTNVSSDHLDLQGIHTLPQLAEVKATVCRVTQPGGLVVLNADDALVAAVARRVRAGVGFFSLDAASPVVARHRRAGGLAWVLDGDRLVELEGPTAHPLLPVADIPMTLGGLATHNVANALAAAGGARAMGATREQVSDGLRDFRPSAELSPGRLNLFRLGAWTVIIDFAHNEAGTTAILDVAAGLAARGGASADAVTAIIGTAGDRPDDTLRGIGRIAATKAGRVAIKETLDYLRGRQRPEIVRLIQEGLAEGGVDASRVPVYATELEALESELRGSGEREAGIAPDATRIVALFCHEERDQIFALLERLGAQPVDPAAVMAATA